MHRICAFLFFLSLTAFGDDWPQWLGPQRDGVWREKKILRAFPKNGPTILWKAPVGGGYAGPSIAGNNVFVLDRQLPTGVSRSTDPFDRGSIPGKERVLCLNDADGSTAWKFEYECPYTVSYAAGPRASPLIDEGHLYTLGAEGNLHCFNAASGKVIWARDLKKDYDMKTPLWGFSAHPLVDGNKLICLVGGSNSVAVAFDKTTGKELWRALSAKEPGYCPPTLISAGEKKQLIIWHPESVNALEPETGKLLWSVPFSSRAGLSVATPRQAGDSLFLTTFYNGSLMLRLDPKQPAPSILWQSKKVSEKDTDALHSIISTPFTEQNHIYGVCSYGQLRCLNAATGERLWETLAATTPDQKETRWATAFIVKQDDRFFLFNEKGDLIIANLGPDGYKERGRAHIIEPTNSDPSRLVVWSHPAFAHRAAYARNDQEIVKVSLAESE